MVHFVQRLHRLGYDGFARSAKLWLVTAMLSPAIAGQIPVDYVDNDGPQWSGYVDTQANAITITSWSDGPGGYWYPVPYDLPFTWQAWASLPVYPPDYYSRIEPYDVPDDWSGRFVTGEGLSWAFVGDRVGSTDYNVGFGGWTVLGVGYGTMISSQGLRMYPLPSVPYGLTYSDPDMVWIEGQAVTGDINWDQRLNAGDLDQLSLAVRLGDQHPAYDLNLDHQVSSFDRLYWIVGLAKTTPGDADLNRAFDSNDLITVFSGGKYETGKLAGWAQGDWDGDGLFNSDDMVTAFQFGGYENPDYAVGVPEPSTLVLTVMGLLGLLLRNRM